MKKERSKDAKQEKKKREKKIKEENDKDHKVEGGAHTHTKPITLIYLFGGGCLKRNLVCRTFDQKLSSLSNHRQTEKKTKARVTHCWATDLFLFTDDYLQLLEKIKMDEEEGRGGQPPKKRE